MKVAIPKERRTGERRVAASPETVKKLKALGLEVAVEHGAGEGASFPDAHYAEAGAAIVADAKALGVSRHHLYFVLLGTRKSPGLLRRYKALKGAQ